MVINIRGSNASGKTYLIQKLIADHDAHPVLGLGERRVPWFYELPGGLYVCRRGETVKSPNGDERNSNEFLRDLIRRFHTEGRHVVFEHVHARSAPWRALSIELNFVWTCLDTPFEICLKRMHDRGRNVNERKMRGFYNRVQREQIVAIQEGVSCVTLNYEHAYDQLHDLLCSGGWACDIHSLKWNWPQLSSSSEKTS